MQKAIKSSSQLHSTLKTLALVLFLVAIIYALMKPVKNASCIFQNLWSGQISCPTSPGPFYGYMQLPARLLYQASGKFSADYASLYFSAKNYLETGVMYDSHVDPFQRPAVTFPPQVIYIVAHTIGGLDFPLSVFSGLFFQLFLFLAASIYFFSNSQTKPSVWNTLLYKQIFFLICGSIYLIFSSAIGLTWVERSQTDLFMATSYLIFLKAIRDGKPKDFFLAGLIASLKWSSLPFIAMAGITHILLSKSKKRSSLMVGLTLALPFILILPFGKNSTEYLELIRNWEGKTPWEGTTLLRFMPPYLAKTTPFIIPLLYSSMKNYQRELEIVFWGLCGLIAVTFGTVVYEYKMVSLIFLLPLIIDGRSIFFEEKKLSLVKRLVFGGIILSYALEITYGLDFWDSFVTINRALKPLLIGIGIFLVSTLLSRRRSTST